jgi:hypothetical protein
MVKIEQIERCKIYEVNGTRVFKNHLGNWQCNVDLTQAELNAFNSYINSINDGLNTRNIGFNRI